MELNDIIEALELEAEVKGSKRALAREIGCSAAYLCDVLLHRRTPGPKILDHMGLKRITVTSHIFVKKGTPC